MSFSRAFQWYHSHLDPIWPEGTFKVKVNREIAQFSPSRTKSMPYATVALTAQYQNVRQRKLGTIIIQTVRILQHESAARFTAWGGICAWAIPTYFQIT